MNILLNKDETRVFGLLKQVLQEKAPNTTLRVAGGWVRDKILGKNSNDIDVAIDNMTGEVFANLTAEYMKEKGIKSGEVTVVEANPEQSKHLATAMLRIFGFPIDFVNLRTETYSDTRIPQMQMGTPQEDASRRDLTINALFYNINTGEVEDFVGGLEDLQNNTARTPLDPVRTFLDDPLRILRTIRFATRFGLTLDPKLIDAANNLQVKQVFKNKISQERIWAELAGKKEGEKWKPGALIGPNPTRAADLLKLLGLMELIFDPTQQEMQELGLTESMVPWDTDQNNPHHSFSIWQHTLSVLENIVDNTSDEIKADSETYLVRNLSALLHDISKRYTGIHGTHPEGHTTYRGHDEVSAKMVEVILTRLHAPSKIIERVKILIDRHLRPHQLLEIGGASAKRRFIRDFEDWHHSIDLAIADSLGKKDHTEEERLSIIKEYENLRTDIINAMPVGQVSTKLPRPISGHDLIQIGIKPGPGMGKIMSAIDEALLENPELTKEEALNIARSSL